MENNHNKPTLFTLQEMLSSLDAIKEIFEERRGWWELVGAGAMVGICTPKGKNGSISFPICTRKGVLGYILNKSQFYFRND